MLKAGRIYLFALLMAVGLFLGDKTHAYWTAGFDSWNGYVANTAIAGIDGWNASSTAAPTSTEFYSGDMALYYGEAFAPVWQFARRVDDVGSEQGSLSFKIYIIQENENPPASLPNFVSLVNDLGQGFNYYWIPMSGIEKLVWHDFVFQWQKTATEGCFRTYWGDNWSDWTCDEDYFFNGKITTTRLDRVALEWEEFYIDDVVFSSSLSGQLADITITPSFPYLCSFITTSTFSGAFTGSVEIAASNNSNWTKFIISAIDNETGNSTSVSTTTNLYAGDTLDYSLPFDFATGSYSLTYYLTGRRLTPYYPQPADFFIYECGGFGVYSTSTIIVEEYPAGIEEEDCDIYSGIDKILCEFKNMIAGIFLPSSGKMQQAIKTLKLIEDRAPLCYISAGFDFFDDLSDDTENNNAYGSTSTLNYNYFSTNVVYSGLTISEMIKIFFWIAITIIFLIWGVNYLTRIFK